jgi:hypothetical protein
VLSNKLLRQCQSLALGDAFNHLITPHFVSQ